MGADFGRKYASVSRREFLRLGSAAVPALLLSSRVVQHSQYEFPDFERLGRVLDPQVAVMARPHPDSTSVASLRQDDVVVWERRVIGDHPRRLNQVWVQTPEGYVYLPNLQPVKNIHNAPEVELPKSSLGSGMWAEVTVPWVEFTLENPPARSPWLRNTEKPRLYYGQVLWIDQIRTDSLGAVWYRVNERYGFGDRFWARAEAFRRITPEEVAPINPEQDDKQVVVRIGDQSLSCFEGGTEVYFTRVSNGVNFDPQGNPIDQSSTPAGPHPIWRKAISMHMVGGTTGGGWDIPGIGWTTLFVGNGVAIHSTYWHNDFGTPQSRGCVNATAEDSKWIFRWVDPVVPYDPGDVTVTMPGGTIVQVVD
jgi:hypothetical protein